MTKKTKIWHKSVVRRSVKTSILVGTMLSIINNWEILINQDFQEIDGLKIFLNFLVPYLVASFTILGYTKK